MLKNLSEIRLGAESAADKEVVSSGSAGGTFGLFGFLRWNKA